MYVSAVITLGALAVATTLPDVQFPRPALFVALLALSVISSAMKVDMPVGVGSSCISLSYAVDFTALLLLGPGAAMLIAMASAWAQCSFRMKERNPPHRTLFSIASLALTVAASGRAYTWLGGTYGQFTTTLQPLLAAAMTYFLVNSVTVAAAFALANRRDIFRVWHDNFLWSITSYAVGAIAAGVAAEVFQRAGHWQTLLAFIPLCLTYRTYRIYLGRIADEQRRVTEWAQLHRESTEVLARAIQAKDGGGTSHVERVQYYATNLARAVELPETDAHAVEIAALLHDIGKLAVPEHILSKPGPLTAHERRKMQIHAQVGAQIVEAVPFPCPVAPVIRSHHERWDGTGYPMGLSGTDIPIGARILAVVDCFDAVTSERPYRRAVTPEAAIRMLEQDAGKAFDPAIVKTFAELLPNLARPVDEPSRGLHLPEIAGIETSMPVAGTIGVDAFAEIALANRESSTLYEIAHGLRACWSTAIFDDQRRVIGTFALYVRRPARPSDADLRLMQIATHTASIAICRKREDEEVRRLNAELEARVVERTRRLEAAMREAQSADLLKSAFLATMSHELRTPLNSIIGFTGVLMRGLAGPVNEEQLKQLGMARESSHRLLALINDVLDISKIEAGQIEVLKTPLDIRSSIESVLRSVTPHVQKKGLSLKAVIGQDVGTIVSDRRRVEQILLNLLSNGVKFTERGEVCLECHVRETVLETSVRDTGIGIRSEDMHRLFKPFQQLETGLGRRHEGTGLGLSICENLTRLLGGAIRAESTWGAGSTFTFTLPLDASLVKVGATAPSESKTGPPDARGATDRATAGG